MLRVSIVFCFVTFPTYSIGSSKQGNIVVETLLPSTQACVAFVAEEEAKTKTIFI